MDTKKPPSQCITPIPPAQLWIGPHQKLITDTMSYLQRYFCPQSCRTCINCTQISERQHHAVIWLQPEKSYTRDDLTPIFNTIAYALDINAHFFFIITHADYLTPVCANSLLKPLEEPPAGYHFILLAEQHNALLPTIRSRCTIIKKEHTMSDIRNAELYALFTRTKIIDGATFLKLIEKESLHERQCQELIDYVFTYWMQQYKKQPSTRTYTYINYIEKLLANGIPPGSSKLILKDMYLNICLNIVNKNE